MTLHRTTLQTMLSLMFGLCIVTLAQAQRHETRLATGWKFTHDDNPRQADETFDDRRWQTVTVPHDWAIDGPFDRAIDMQKVAIVQNGEKVATEKTGRSGSLPWIGVGWYRTRFDVPANSGRVILHFDGAMSEPQVYVNGQKAGEWKYGYSAFFLEITRFVHQDGAPNTLAVRLQNVEESSRWYPGAGLFRPVTLVTTGRKALDEWGIDVRTAAIHHDTHSATVELSAQFVGCEGDERCEATIISPTGTPVCTQTLAVSATGQASLRTDVANAALWTPETPALYTLRLRLTDQQGDEADSKTVKFGIRTVAVSEANGFVLNGQSRKFRGVCLHHDLGMLGAAVNKAALAHQLTLLKSMGCDAIRTSHNMPSQWQMELCDSLGLMVMAESFDMWRYPKCKNGYARFFDDWWQRDLTNLVLANRLHPSIVMWSIGNEIPEQGSQEGNILTRQMQDHMHALDATRPVTSGMDRIDNAIASGFAHVLDVPGINYRTHRYRAAHEKLRQGFVLGSETASTVSSRGVYKFPPVPRKSYAYEDGQCNGYDTEACSWSNLPEEDWALQDDQPWVIGEFVWTGFDYLGEPTPYDEYWPSRSSYFGIFDLAGLPKDRYWLYRSRWNKQEHTLHVLPHWTWPGRVGEVTPVYCYTDYPTAELFVNGVSQGRISKQPTTSVSVTEQDQSLLDRYRLRWNDVRYEPGELRVVAYDADGRPAGETTVHTAGTPHHLRLTANRDTLAADGEDMAFVTVEVVDADGNLCPDADTPLQVKVSGAGAFKGICNGDATSLEPFTRPAMRAFKGKLMVGIITRQTRGNIHVTVTGKKLKAQTLTLRAE